MLRTEIAAQEVEATGIEVEYATTGIQAMTCEIPYQAVPPAASTRIYDDDARQYFRGQVVRHKQGDDGRVWVEAWAMDYRLRRRQIYDEVTYTEQDGGAIIRDRLAPHEWADVSGVPTNLGTIASIPFVNTTDAKVIEEVAAICNVLAYWDMTTGIYRAHPVGTRSLPDPLPEAITREIIWAVDESEIYNAIVARGGEVAGVPLSTTLTDAASIATYGRREKPVYTNQSITDQATLDKIAAHLLASSKDPRVSTDVRGVAFDPTGPNGSPAGWIGQTVRVSGTTNDGEYLIAAIRANLDNMTMDLTLSNRPYTLEGAIKAMEKEIQLMRIKA
jgi:hypothetical protein